MLMWIHCNPYTLTLIDTPSLRLDSWQFLMVPLINHYMLTSMCASYIRQGRVTEFVPIDVALAQQPIHPLRVRSNPSNPPNPLLTRPRPALARLLLYYIPHPVPRHSKWPKCQRISVGMEIGPGAARPCNLLLVTQTLPYISLSVKAL